MHENVPLQITEAKLDTCQHSNHYVISCNVFDVVTFILANRTGVHMHRPNSVYCDSS